MNHHSLQGLPSLSQSDKDLIPAEVSGTDAWPTKIRVLLLVGLNVTVVQLDGTVALPHHSIRIFQIFQSYELVRDLEKSVQKLSIFAEASKLLLFTRRSTGLSQPNVQNWYISSISPCIH